MYVDTAYQHTFNHGMLLENRKEVHFDANFAQLTMVRLTRAKTYRTCPDFPLPEIELYRFNTLMFNAKIIEGAGNKVARNMSGDKRDK